MLGYHPPADLVNNDPRPPLINTLNPTEKLVFFGLPSDSPDKLPRPTYQGRTIPVAGCIGTASRKIAGDAEMGHSQLSARIDFEAFRDSEHDPQVTAVFGQWSACMKQAGYNYRDPLAAVADHRWSTPQPTPAEISTVLADIACQQRTHLVDVWHRVESDYQLKQMAAHKAELETVQQDKQRQLDVINSVLGN